MAPHEDPVPAPREERRPDHAGTEHARRGRRAGGLDTQRLREADDRVLGRGVAGGRGPASAPAIEAVFTMWPKRCRSMIGYAACTPWTTPRRLTSMMRFQPSIV